MIFALDLPDGRATVRAASWYDAREWARAKGIPFPALEVIPGASEESGAFAFDAPPANATPAEVAADYARGIHAAGVLEGVRECVRMIDAGDRDRSVRRGIAAGLRATFPGAFR